MDGHECQGFRFYANFDSANLRRVEFVPKDDENDTPHTTITGKTDAVDYEFNLWTKPDCAGTEFENGNRTWFYFAVKTPLPLVYTKFNIVDMNKQAKLYGQGMVPVYRIVPSGKQNWDRILEKPTFTVDDVFTLSYKFRMPENINAVVYFAFTFPYSYADLQTKLDAIDRKQRRSDRVDSLDDVYYVRETVCETLQRRRVDLLTITSLHGITDRREARLRHLFPDRSVERPYHFKHKKVIFLSARVHPGETPSSFVLNGFLNLILSREDHVAQALRRLYVFKIIPCLNPDGVANGHYRTDTRGVNLNRVYLDPSPVEHPTIYAARALVRYAHDERDPAEATTDAEVDVVLDDGDGDGENDEKKERAPPAEPPDGGLFLYLDMHGHASKKGIFMYGNHFADLESNVRCMLLPKVMSLNNQNFHFTACNFTERNMYLKDKRDGMSREGSGRVAVYKLTGLIQCYTLECNYNTGRIVNHLPPCVREGARFAPNLVVPPKYGPAVFEEVGRALGASILDLTGSNCNTRIAHSEHHSLAGLREWLRLHCTYNLGGGGTRKAPKKAKVRPAASLLAQGKPARPSLKTRTYPTKCHGKKPGAKQRQAAARRKQRCASPQPSGSVAAVASSSSSSGGCRASSPMAAATAGGGRRPASGVNFVARNIRNASSAAGELKVKEICYVKSAAGKRVIATYEQNNRVLPENLIVAWDAAGARPQVFTHRPRAPPPAAFLARRVVTGDGEAGAHRAAYRAHNFQKQKQAGGQQQQQQPTAAATALAKAKLSKRAFRAAHASADNVKAAKAKGRPAQKKKKKTKCRAADAVYE